MLFRNIDALTVKDVYSKLEMDDSLELVGKACIYSTLDTGSALWQIAIEHGDKEKATFTSHPGLSKFFRVPLNPKDTPRMIKRRMDSLN